MKNIKQLEEKPKEETYDPTADDRILQAFVSRRQEEMKQYRTSLGIEKDWKEADIEYIPHELDFGSPRKRFETDQDTGLRSRLVPIGDDTQDWRSNSSAPTLLVKIQTAFGIMIDQNPEAMLTALQKKYEPTTEIAYSLWKRNWSITDAKETLKLFVFDLLKYGWAVGRSHPKKITYKKSVLVELDSEDPSKNVYEERELTWFNDVARQRLSPYRTWIDEQTKPYDVYSMNDCYYELDYSYDDAKLEFGEYANFDKVKPDSRVSDTDEEKPGTTNDQEDLKTRKDIVTIGFYQNRAKDLYVILVPKDKIILHNCPLPNDDGLLDIWQSMWILRSSDMPYGLSIWNIIKQDKILYDKMNNMTMDQLVLSIMKFGFHTGTSGVLGDGVIKIVPGQSKQITNGKFDWMVVPGPGPEAWQGLDHVAKNIDDNSGITPTIEGELTGKTLGEIQLAREASLKRLKSPLDNIAWAIEQDAYLTLSWMKQIYSTPEIMEFATKEELEAYNLEFGVEHNELYQESNPETGEAVGFTATYLPELALHLEDNDGELFESEKSRFFQIGKDLPVEKLNWKGIFKVIPRSILGTSETIIKQTKMELANLLIPLLIQPPELVMKSAIQMIKINEEDPKDWLPDFWLNPPAPVAPEMPVEEQVDTETLFTPKAEVTDETVTEELVQPQVQAPAPQNAPKTVVPKGEVSSPSPIGKLFSGMFKRKS